MGFLFVDDVFRKFYSFGLPMLRLLCLLIKDASIQVDILRRAESGNWEVGYTVPDNLVDFSNHHIFQAYPNS